MPKSRSYSLLIAVYPYAGNSTGSSLCWPTSEWLTRTMVRLKTEDKFKEKIHERYMESFCDTPITMTRNLSVKVARQLGCDLLLMVDSDMGPDMYLGQSGAEPFFDVALEAIDRHYDKGPLVVAAPYGGCPPHENIFTFTWSALMNAGEESPFELRQYTREEAQSLSGLHEAAALPTGLILYDMRAFDYIQEPYFRYEWTDASETNKASTEDVQNTRDIGLAVQHALGYNPLLCAWSCWAAHHKVWKVGKPSKYTTEQVAENLANAVRRGASNRECVVDVKQFLEQINGYSPRAAEPAYG